MTRWPPAPPPGPGTPARRRGWCSPATRRAAPGRRVPGEPGHPGRGGRVADLPEGARQRVLDVVATFIAPLPAGPRTARLREVADHLDETWFSWIGGHGPGDVFYCRVRSPVVVAELDHHCGVLLDSDTPPALPRAHRAAHPARRRLRPRLGPAVPGARRRLSGPQPASSSSSSSSSCWASPASSYPSAGPAMTA
ncbi:DUF3500 domain-containing protein [Geodermatophilus sp. SYSU D01045]